MCVDLLILSRWYGILQRRHWSEHLPTQISYDNKLQSGQDPNEDDQKLKEGDVLFKVEFYLIWHNHLSICDDNLTSICDQNDTNAFISALFNNYSEAQYNWHGYVHLHESTCDLLFQRQQQNTHTQLLLWCFWNASHALFFFFFWTQTCILT